MEVPSLLEKKDEIIIDTIEKEIFASSEKFKENEKNLNEDRLKKESKIEIPLTVETKKLGKQITAIEFNADDIINNVSPIKDKVSSPLKQTQQTVSDINLKRNVSQNNISNKNTLKNEVLMKNDVSEHSMSIKNEGKRL